MITITPQGQVYLCKTPLENDYKNQLSFENANSQLTYFNSTIQKTFDNYTYIKKDNVIKVGCNIDEIIDCNYLFYRNIGFTNKIYYCFITNMVYINENCTAITFETDCFQTWLFQLQPKICFVEREHVNDDSIGLHTIPENVEIGEPIVQGVSNLEPSNYYVVIAVSEDILRTDETTYHHKYNGVVSGLTYIALQSSVDVNYFISRYNTAGKIDSISSLFMVPEEYVVPLTWLTDSSGTIHYKYISERNTPFELGSVDIIKPSILGEGDEGYTPKNNKLLTFPYCYILADNNAGANVVYKYEDFKAPEGATANTCRFSAIGTINAGCSIKYIPINYKNIDKNYNESFNGAKLPLGGWINDVYVNWLRQNGLNIAINTAGSVLQIVGGLGLAGTGAGSVSGAGQVASGITGIASTIGQIYQHNLIPNQAEGNINSSDIMFSAGKSGASIYQMSIKIEYLKVIDEFFSMFGYKVNELKVPNLYGRANWNYVKTIDCNFDGNIPQVDLNIIKAMFNKGVTLWHNPSTMYNYNANNDIV